ncbi:MAG: DUF3291 domain-containing protein [Minwuia sp.]|uniref:DUF3291 domain-containing protein n=1 Tax=Minwuia sp. TaxID=2493630 RepID=UPI003A846A24
MNGHHLAQLNIARWKVDPDGAAAADFVNSLDRINALAEASPGFVWRLKDDDTGNAMSVEQPFGEGHIVNLSVWTSIKALRAFVYASGHRDVMARRREWFANAGAPHMVLWWVPAGHRPDVMEARDRLQTPAALGAGPDAFTFARSFPEPAAAA